MKIVCAVAKRFTLTSLFFTELVALQLAEYLSGIFPHDHRGDHVGDPSRIGDG